MIHNPRLIAALREGLPAALAATLVLLFTYIAAQQVYRMSANDPQIQIAEDTAGQLTAGARPESLVDQTHLVDLATGLATWVAIYNDAGTILVSSARLHGAMPQMPPGLLANVRDGSQERVTLQPEGGVRAAVVVARFTGAQPGFVVVGRSLREVELRESNLLNAALIAWFVTMVAIFGLCFALVPKPIAVSQRDV